MGIGWKSALAVVILAVITGGTSAYAADPPRLHPLRLAEVVELLQSNNRDIRLARRAVDVARAINLSAAARPNPVLSAGTTAIDPRNPGAGALWSKPFDTVVQVSQLVERGDKRALRDEGTRLVAGASGDDLADVIRLQVRTGTALYYELLGAQARVRIADDTLELLARTVAAATLRLKAGDIAPSDLSRIRVDLLRAENDRSQAIATRERARADLAFALGLEGEAVSLEAVDPWPEVETVAMPGDVGAIVSARADVHAAATRVTAADKFRALARALRTRDVTVAAQVERYPGQVHENSIGVGVSVPLFLNYDYEGEIRRGEAEYLAAQDSLARVRAAALVEIRQAWSDLAAAQDRVRRFDRELLAEATRAAGAAEFAYRNGALGVIDLLDARRVLVATQVDAVSARADLGKAAAAWRAATQPKETTR